MNRIGVDAEHDRDRATDATVTTRAEVLIETIHHHARFLRRTSEPPGWTSRCRELVGSIDASLHDLRDERWRSCLDPDDIALALSLAHARHAEGSDGLVYPSVRYPNGQCIAAFWPDVVGVPVQGRHYRYHWNGQAVDLTRDETSGETFRVTP